MKKFIICLIALNWPLSAVAQDADAGRGIFDTYCAACHGTDARGAGPMAQVLMIPPSDLTQLANRSAGTFPTSEVIAKIDGRTPLLSHGSPMPVFGGFFEGKGVTMRGEEGMLIMTSQPIIDLVTYLETIQDAP